LARRLKIVVCLDSFKGTMSAIEASSIVAKVLRDEGFDVKAIPVADGGEGTSEVIKYNLGGKYKTVTALDPLGKPIKAKYLVFSKGIVLEIAQTSGLYLVELHKRNPLFTSTKGFGILLKKSLSENYKTYFIGLGGSATNDAGIGLLAELGVKFYDKAGRLLKNDGAGLSGKDLKMIDDIDASDIVTLFKGKKIVVLTDVENVLTGKDGTSLNYSQQKGADTKITNILENGMKHYASVLRKVFNKDPEFKSSGAAGGVAASLKIILGAEIRQGINELVSMFNLEKELALSDVVIVGEGKMDFQTAYGKAPIGVANIVNKKTTAVYAITGTTGKDANFLLSQGIDMIVSCFKPDTYEWSYIRKNAQKKLIKAAYKLSEVIKSRKQKEIVYV